MLPSAKLKQVGAGLTLLLFAAISYAQAVPQADLSFAYSHLLVDTDPEVNLDGADFSGAFNFDQWFGVIGDLGVYHGSQAGAGVTGITYSVGARISYRKLDKLVPYIQGLVGAGHVSRNLAGTSGSQNPLCYAFGAGFDLELDRAGKVALRPQVEYVGFSHITGSITDAARFSIGAVYRFGKIRQAPQN